MARKVNLSAINAELNALDWQPPIADTLRDYYATAGIPKTYREKKPRARIRVKAKPKAERDRIADVRQQCVDRDGYCRIQKDCIWPVDGPRYSCEGPSEWMHMHARRRSKTRGLAPAERHDTRYSLMGCQFHHSEYDAKRLIITALTRKGADGPLKFRRAK